jgi:chromosomal replication initiation ATPase DnaA
VSVISLQGLVEKMARYYKIDPKNLKSASKERPITEARRVLCYIAVRKLDSYQFSFAQKAQNIFQFLCKPLLYRRLRR